VYHRRVRVVCSSFAAGLSHLSIVVTLAAPAAPYLGEGLRRPCRGQACGGELEAKERKSPCATHLVALNNQVFDSNALKHYAYGKTRRTTTQPVSQAHEIQIFRAPHQAGPSARVRVGPELARFDYITRPRAVRTFPAWCSWINLKNKIRGVFWSC
jgi:hypothetical protein